MERNPRLKPQTEATKKPSASDSSSTVSTGLNRPATSSTGLSNKWTTATRTSFVGNPNSNSHSFHRNSSSNNNSTTSSTNHGETGNNNLTSSTYSGSGRGIVGSNSGYSAMSSARSSTTSNSAYLQQSSSTKPSATSSASSSLRRTSDKTPMSTVNLVEKLVKQILGTSSPMSTRKSAIRLTETGFSEPMDNLTIIEQMKRRIYSDSSLFEENTQEVISKLNEAYARFMRTRSIDKKSEVLYLLLKLMNTSIPTDQHIKKETTDYHHQSYYASESFSSARSSRTDPTFDAKMAASASISSQLEEPFPQPLPPSEMDVLEDSFRISVGIPSGTTKQEKSKSTGSKAGNQKMNGFSHFTSLEVPEDVLLSQILFALQAIDSRYIYFDAAVDRFQITRSIGVPAPMRDLIHKLCELGWFYRKIQDYIKRHREELSFGVVGQSFCHALNADLSDYFRLIAVLASQVDEDAEHRERETNTLSELTLRRLLVWTEDPMDKMRLMTRLIDTVDGLRGGELASGIHAHLSHGDPFVFRYIQSVMKKVAAPILRMIRRWVFEGELEDAHGEFFVVGDPNVSDDLLWSHKYKLNTKMIPTFISLELAKKILIIGKSINFIRQCCGNTEWVLRAAKEAIVSSTSIDSFNAFERKNQEDSNGPNGSHFYELTKLKAVIENISKNTNQYLIDTLMGKYQLLDHCRALKRYLLLGQGDFIQYLMDLLGPELSKRATQIYRHNLTNVLETALNSSNAKFENQEILSRLDVKILQASPGDDGWDVFSLHYKLPSPINTIINDTCMREYLRIFHFLWRLKRVEYSLSTCWCRDMNLTHIVRNRVPAIGSTFHKCHLLRTEMIHFTTNLHNYVMFEVLETSWSKLVKDLKAAKDMDELIQSHEEYIAAIKENAFMLSNSKELLIQLKQVLDTIIKFCKVQEMLYTAALREVHAQKMREHNIEVRTTAGQWGSNAAESYHDRMRSEMLTTNSKIIVQIQEIAQDYNTQFLALLEMIKARGTNTESLPFLVFRFDFNEYYRAKNAPEDEE